MYRKIRDTCHCNEPSACGKQDPNNSLTSRNFIRGSRVPQLPQPYLLPEEASKTKHASTTTTQTYQTKKHDENQDNICDEHDNECKFVMLHVWQHAGLIPR